MRVTTRVQQAAWWHKPLHIHFIDIKHQILYVILAYVVHENRAGRALLLYAENVCWVLKLKVVVIVVIVVVIVVDMSRDALHDYVMEWVLAC